MAGRKLLLNRSNLKVGAGLALVLSLLLPLGSALAEPNFVDLLFRDKWTRSDKSVQESNSRPPRSWLWGPEGFEPGVGTTEPYYDSPNGLRTVEYFDKARMEINQPDKSGVTNGLLVREMISGRMATSDTSFLSRRPADDIPVAGDPDGNDGPTYASFAKIASLENDNPSPDRTGSPVDETLDKAGILGKSAALGAKARYVYFDSNLKHNIPDVFWNFLNQKGNVYVFPADIFAQPTLVDNQPVLGNNLTTPWVEAMGLPVTEAYWARVTVNGKTQDVLVQAYERRVLTFTPANQPAFQVEMGNVGRHYASWRYNSKYDLFNPLGCGNVPDGTGGAFSYFKCGPANTQVRVGIQGLQPNEGVTLVATDSNGKRALTMNFTGNEGADSSGFLDTSVNTPFSAPQGIWSFVFTGQASGETAITYVRLDPPVSTPSLIFLPGIGTEKTSFGLQIAGFQYNENIKVVFTAPNGAMAILDRKTNEYGGYSLAKRPIDMDPFRNGAPTGNWTITVSASNDANRKVSLPFTVNAPAPNRCGEFSFNREPGGLADFGAILPQIGPWYEMARCFGLNGGDQIAGGVQVAGPERDVKPAISVAGVPKRG